MRQLRAWVVIATGFGCGAGMALATGCNGLDDTLSGSDGVHGLGGHDPDPVDPWSLLEREQREGPPRYTSRVHSCAKMRYGTLGTVLASRGVDLAATDPVSAGVIYATSAQALGAPQYFARIRENLELGVAIAARLDEIYLQAAPEIIAHIGERPACAGVQLFTADGHCVPDGVTCLLGVPATPAHLDICNHTVMAAADVATGERLAVAMLAAAAGTCE
jgi:hypothetical protein